MLRQVSEKIAHKIPRLPRWGKRGIALLSVIVCAAFSSFISSALTPVYFKYARPPVTDNSGYIEVAFDGSYYVFVVLGSYGTVSGGSNIGSNPLVASYNQNSHTLSIHYSMSGSFSRVYGYWIRNDGKIWGVEPSEDTGQITITVASSGSPEILRFYGIQPLTSECEFGTSDKVYVYGEDTTLNSNIDFCCNLLSQIKTTNDTQNEKIQAILDKLVFTNEQLIASHEMYVNIWNSAYSIDKKLDTITELLQKSQAQADKNTNEIKKNQDENSQKIIDNQKELQQKEKDEAQQSGDKSTKDTQAAIPTVNEGFGSALKSFIASMSYNGTEAKLPIPRAYLPAMSGITEEITLIPEQDYDMSQAINDYLPETLLQLIRYLFTIALILYCVYELYGLIQYVLTLRKGGKEE